MSAPVSFASYSRRDKAYVEPVVDLLRSGAAHVFVDQDNIQPGDRWEMVLETNLETAATLLVFWSKNAKESDWVAKEWTHAAQAKKRIIPVLLDGTPLPKELSAYQYIDFRHFRKPSPWTPALAAISLLALATTFLLWSQTAKPTPADGPPIPGERPLVEPFWESDPWIVAGLAFGILLILTLVTAFARSRAKAKQTAELAKDIATQAIGPKAVG